MIAGLLGKVSRHTIEVLVQYQLQDETLVGNGWKDNIILIANGN